MDEIWKDIVVTKGDITYDYSGKYQVSNLGRVRRLDMVDVMGRKRKCVVYKPQLDKSGYLRVVLQKDGEMKGFLVHRLVATAFIPNPNNLPYVNHRDECKTNNCVENLEWCDASYNTKYSLYKYIHKLKGENHPMYGRKGEKSPGARKVVCLETGEVFGSIKDANEWIGKGDVAHCLRGRTKTAGGYHWQYLDDYKRELRLQSDVRNSRLVA